jgi:predicted RNA-binding Zn ribbon-like protein
VVIDSAPPSRADTLALVGGDIAFDFTNTSSGRGWPSRQEHLRSAINVIDWARHAKLLGPADGDWLRRAAAADAQLASRLLRSALELREIIYATAVEIAARRPTPRAPMEALARIHAACLACAKLTPFEGRYVWTWTANETPVEAVLGPITLSALATLTQGDLSRIKQCQGEKCGWLFFDATKNKSRRWCEMEVCGNRAKQRRHTARKRSA